MAAHPIAGVLPRPGNEEEMNDAVSRAVARRILPVLFAGALAAYLDRTNLAFAALEMNPDLNFSERTYGLGAGIFFATYSVCGIPSSVMVQRVGIPTGLSLILIAWALASAAMALVQTTWHFYVVRLLIGAAEAGYFPSAVYYLTLWCTDEQIATSYSLVMTATALSGVVGGPAAATIMSWLDGVAGLEGWRWLFIIEAIPSFALGLFVRAFLDRCPDEARFLDPEERSFLVLRQDKEIASRSHGSPVNGLKAIVTSAWTWILALVWLLYSMAFYGILYFLPLLIKSVSETESVMFVSLASTIPYVFASFAMVIVARSSDKNKERPMHLAVAALVGAAGLIGAGTLQLFAKHSLWSSLLLLTIASGGIWSMFGPFWGIPTAILSGETASAGFALINGVGVVGGLLGPTLLGSIFGESGSFSFGLLCLGGCVLLSAVLVLSLRRKLLVRSYYDDHTTESARAYLVVDDAMSD